MNLKLTVMVQKKVFGRPIPLDPAANWWEQE
jgi:hypothetical protein